MYHFLQIKPSSILNGIQSFLFQPLFALCPNFLYAVVTGRISRCKSPSETQLLHSFQHMLISVDGQVVEHYQHVVEWVLPSKLVQEELELRHVDGPLKGHCQIYSLLSGNCCQYCNGTIIQLGEVQAGIDVLQIPICFWY